MLLVENLDYTIVILLSIVIMICSIGIVVSSLANASRKREKIDEIALPDNSSERT